MFLNMKVEESCAADAIVKNKTKSSKQTSVKETDDIELLW